MNASVTQRIKHAFGAAANTYDSVAALQRRVGRDLLAKAITSGMTGTILDLGCGTGFIAGEVATVTPGEMDIIALDIALPMLQTARMKLPDLNALSYVCGDLSSLPLSEHSVDFILSNLVLQWCGDLTLAFRECRRILKPNGKIMFSTFGPDTLNELKQAWLKIDDLRHVNEFAACELIVEALEKAGFGDVSVAQDKAVPVYRSVWSLLYELKHLGAGTVLHGRGRQLVTKAKVERMIQAYPQAIEGEGYPATFEIIKVQAVRRN